MAWTFEEIEREWFGGPFLQMPPVLVEKAFEAAEQVRGREWVLGQKIDLGSQSFPGLGPRGGFSQFIRVCNFGNRLQSIAGVLGADALIERLLKNDDAAESELAAIHLLRARRPESIVEIGPDIMVGNRHRRPDFKKRIGTDPWTHVEVTQLNRSGLSKKMENALQRIAGHVISVVRPFLLEIILLREPKEGEEEELVNKAYEACQTANGSRREVGDLALVIVKAGDPATIVPTILPEDNGSKMAFAQSIGGPGEPNRQIVVRAPFADQRAEDILTAEARQLPKGEPGLIMVDVTRQPTAVDSWPKSVSRRFTPTQHTRVSGVLLFMGAITGIPQGTGWITYSKLIPNRHARIGVPAWISEAVEEARAESRRLTGYSD